MKPNDQYAGFIEMLRSPAMAHYEYDADQGAILQQAADILEAVLAERDALKDILPNQNHEGRAPIPTDWWEVAVLERRKRRAAEKERDTLLARLAPVDDKALVEIVARKIFIERRSLAAAIAAIRPHIEAAEREKCAKIVDERYWDANQSDGHIDGWNGAVKTIAAAIRSGE